MEKHMGKETQFLGSCIEVLGVLTCSFLLDLHLDGKAPKLLLGVVL